MTDLMIQIVIFGAGMIVGSLVRYWIASRTGHSGTIVVTQKAEGVKLYSLEGIDQDDLESKDEVVFKIERSQDM